MPLLASFLLAYLFYPVYHWVAKKVKNRAVIAFIVSFIIILLVTIPIAYVLYEFSKEANVGYIVLKQKITTGNIFDIECTQGTTICDGLTGLKELMKQPEVKFYMEDSLKKITTTVAESTFNFIFSLPRRLFEIFITFFITFFLLKDGPLLVKKIEDLIPLKRTLKDKIILKLHAVIKAIIYGVFIVALIECVLGALTF